MRRYAPLALILIASFTFSVVSASGAVSANSQQFGGTNGRVNSIVRVGNVVYVGGKFTQVRDRQRRHLPAEQPGGVQSHRWQRDRLEPQRQR